MTFAIDKTDYISIKEKDRRILEKYIDKKHHPKASGKENADGPKENDKEVYIDGRAYASARKSLHLENFLEETSRRSRDNLSLVKRSPSYHKRGHS